MTSWMNIRVRVNAGASKAQLAALQAQINSVAAASRRSAATPMMGPTALPKLTKFGNQLQWTGRQIQYNFTLPLLLAAGAATKWELDNQKAMTHVAKVYGDTQAAAAQFRRENKGLSREMSENKAAAVFAGELRELDKAFVAISNHYGVQQSEVLKVAGAWAAAGVSGRALADSVNLTMQAIIIGDMDAAKATKSLISIQAQYNLSSKELAATLAQLNAVENSTGIDMAGLIDGFERSAGVAREAGVSTRYLAAMLAALVPSTGSAAQAGNALKTIISRLLAPTRQATEVLGEMGIKVDSASWQSSTFVERLMKVRGAYVKLTGPQKAYAASFIASRYQINKFTQLMDQLGPSFGYYEKALDATSSRTKSFATMQKELNAVLNSNPQKLKQIWTILQNAMADVVQPMIPYLVALANTVKNLVTSFSHLPQPVQSVVLGMLLMLAVFGPILRYVGSTITLLATLGGALHFVAGRLGLVAVEGAAARGGVVAFLKSLVVGPILFFATVMQTAFGAMSAAFMGFFRFMALGFTKLFMVINPIIAVGTTLMANVWRVGFSAMRGMYAVFIAQWRVLTLAHMLGEITLNQLMHARLILMQGAANLVQLRMTAVFGGMMQILTMKWLFNILKLHMTFGISLSGIWAATTLRVAAIWSTFLRFMTITSIVGAFKAMIRYVAMAAVAVGEALLSPWGIAIAAVVGLLYAFRSQIAQVWNNIVSYFQNSGSGLADFWNGMINDIVKMFYKLPTGVQNAMMAVVRIVHDAAMAVYNLFQYLNPFAHHSPSLVENVAKGMSAVVGSFKTLNSVVLPFQNAYNMAQKFGKATAGLVMAAQKLEQAQQRAQIKKFAPGSIGLYDQMAKEINRLTPVLNKNKAAMDAQQRVVDVWQNKVKGANNALDVEQNKLDALTKIADMYKNKIDEINGAKELLSGDQSALRSAGAGSDVLSGYDAQLKALEAQKGQYTDAAKAAAAQQAVVDAATKKRDAYQASLDREQLSLDVLTNKYDNVSNAIQAMQDAMNAAASAAGDLQGARDAANQAKNSSAGKSHKNASDSLKGKKPKAIDSTVAGFRAAGKGDFPQLKGKGMKMRTDWKSQVPDIKDFTKKLSDQTAKMFGDLNPFGGLKDKASAVFGWIGNKASELGSGISGFFSSAFKGLDGPAGNVKQTLSSMGKTALGIFHDIGKAVGNVWDLLGPDVIKIFNELKKGIVDVWNTVGPELAKFGPVIGNMGKAFKNMYAVAKPIFAILGTVALFFMKIILSMLADVIGPVFHAIGQILAGFYRVFRGIFEVIIGILTGDWKMAWQGVLDILSGTWKAIWGLVGGLVNSVEHLIGGFVRGIVNFFKWLFDVLVGHSIIPDMVHAIIDVFKWLGAIPEWIKDHVLKPVIEGFKWVWERIIAGLKQWWSWIKDAWKGLTTAAAWVKDHVLSPIGDSFRSIWERIVSGLRQWWTWIKEAWKGLTTVGSWIKDNMMDPIFNKIKSGWEKIRDWLGDAKNILMKPIKSIVNAAIDGVNFLIRGINKISDVLPGIKFHVDLIPGFADGGNIPSRRANAGFKTNGARAIVGEGKANHPEFVIPTDPTYRRRAISLLGQAASKIGIAGGQRDRGQRGDTPKDMANWMANDAGAVPMYWSGGILGKLNPKSLAKGAKSWMVGNLHKLASRVYDPIANQGKDWINNHTSWVPRQAGNYGINQVGKWVGAVDDEAYSLSGSIKSVLADIFGGGPAVKRAQKFAKGQVGKPYVWGGVGPGGYDCSGFMSAITNVLRGKNPYSRVGATASFPWGGFSGGYDKNGFTIGSTKSYGGSGIGHMAGTLGGMNVESRGGQGVIIGSGARGWNDGGFGTHAHLGSGSKTGALAAAGLARGGIAKARNGGMLANIAEAGRDEAVIPLPHNWRTDTLGGKKEYNFYGDLSFPNITSPEDAQTFLDNLENLAKD